jgi:hypothetical protein
MLLYVEYWREEADLLRVAGRINLLKNICSLKSRPLNGIAGQLQIMRKSQYLDHGGFDIPPSLVMSSDDSDSSDDYPKFFLEFEGNLSCHLRINVWKMFF